MEKKLECCMAFNDESGGIVPILQGQTLDTIITVPRTTVVMNIAAPVSVLQEYYNEAIA